MCGRFTQYFTWRELHERYELTGAALNIEPRYNIAPTTQVVVVRGESGKRWASKMRWGLMPQWMKVEPGRPMPATFNARAETVATKPTFRSAFKTRRCIVPVSGYYEWKTEGKVKRPFHVLPAEGGMLSLAGLWEVREDGGEETLSCTIITTNANATMAPIHDRMPVVLGPYDLDAWLSGRAGQADLKPCPPGWIKPVEVDPFVNSVRNQGEACIVPLKAG